MSAQPASASSEAPASSSSSSSKPRTALDFNLPKGDKFLVNSRGQRLHLRTFLPEAGEKKMTARAQPIKSCITDYNSAVGKVGCHTYTRLGLRVWYLYTLFLTSREPRSKCRGEVTPFFDFLVCCFHQFSLRLAPRHGTVSSTCRVEWNRM